MKTAIFLSYIVAFAFGWATIECFPDFWLWFDGDYDANMAAWYFAGFAACVAIFMFTLAEWHETTRPVTIKSSDIKYIQIPRNTRNKYGFPNT